MAVRLYHSEHGTRNSELPTGFSPPQCRFTFPPVLNRPGIAFLALLTLACGGKSAKPAPEPAPTREPVRPLITTTFAGQMIAVTPLTLVVSEDPLTSMEPLTDRARTLAWADSLIGAAVTGRSPEVKWVLPPELRKIARRAPTVAPDPDRMGQSLLRGAKIEDVPDPLRGNLRALMAIVGGRYALVPAALAFVNEPAPSSTPVRAELSIVLVDTRTGKVAWRSHAWGTGLTPERALVGALNSVFPVGLGLR